jgi:hypothetical protein
MIMTIALTAVGVFLAGIVAMILSVELSTSRRRRAPYPSPVRPRKKRGGRRPSPPSPSSDVGDAYAEMVRDFTTKKKG